MNDQYGAIGIAATLIFLVLVLWALLHTAAQCHANGGIPVRGLIWLECIHD